MTDDLPKPRWYRLTPDRLLIGLLIVECLLWLSERFGWPTWHKGYAVLTAVAAWAWPSWNAALVLRRPTLPVAIPVQHSVAAGYGRGRGDPV